MRQLLRNLGDQFNLPPTAIGNLDVEAFIESAIAAENATAAVARDSGIFLSSHTPFYTLF